MKEQGEGFRCSDLSRKTNIPHDTILQILKGNTKNPGINTVAKIAKALNSSIDELVGNIPKNPLYNVKIEDTNLFIEIVSFITEEIKKDVYVFDSSDFFKTVLSIYSYSIEQKKIDAKFASWCIKTYLLRIPVAE